MTEHEETERMECEVMSKEPITSHLTHLTTFHLPYGAGTAGERMVSGGEGMVVTRDVNVRQEPDDWENTPYIHILFLSLPSLSSHHLPLHLVSRSAARRVRHEMRERRREKIPREGEFTLRTDP